MKGFIYLSAFLVLAVAVSASYPTSPEGYFDFKQATCAPDGSMLINVTHNGINMKFSDVTFTIQSDKLGSQKLLGIWMYDGGGDPGNYTGPDFVEPQLFIYNVTKGIYTAGKYKITLSWPTADIYYNNVQFAVTCPGIPCSGDDQCISQQSCVAGQCQWLDCGDAGYGSGHSCFSRCDDHNICTKDYSVDGKCVFAPIDGCCNTNADCNANEYCGGNACKQNMFYHRPNSIFGRILSWLFG